VPRHDRLTGDGAGRDGREEVAMGVATRPRILVVDDDERVRTVVTWQLEADGFLVHEAGDGDDALDLIERERPDLLVLDLSLPRLGGLDVIRRVRRGGAGRPDLPVIVLSGRSGETDRIVGLDLGADDYLVKPFSPGELAARVRSVLRRARGGHGDDPGRAGVAGDGPRDEEALIAHPRGDGPRDGALTVDERTRDVTVDGHAVDLTAKEFDLLAFLARHPRQVFTRAQLLRHVWGSASHWQSEATVTEHVHRLRRKIEADPTRPARLCTVRGVGYRLEVT
jgi:DNA-binding response OmpR family regulator